MRRMRLRPPLSLTLMFHNISSATRLYGMLARRPGWLVTGMLAVGMLMLPAPVQAADVIMPADLSRCVNIRAFADDPDPAGLNLRTGPSLDSPIIGALKLHVFARDAVGRDLLQAPGFAVLGSYRGWLLVSEIAYPDPPADPLPAGPGWVHGSRVSVRTLSAADAAPRLHAKAGGGDAGTPAVGLRFSVLECSGGWLNVRERLSPGEARPPLAGWLAPGDACFEQAGLSRPVNPCTRR